MDETNLQSSSDVHSSEDPKNSKDTTSLQWRDFIQNLKKQWKTLWRDRIDDKLRAEGIARDDYPLLFVDKGTVIVATKKCKPPDFLEILRRHAQPTRVIQATQIGPSSSGWGKFIRTVVKAESRLSRRMRPPLLERKRGENLQQKKKGGRGWIHRS